MAGETIKTKGIVLDIHPWSRTSHVTTWLTPDHGPVTTLVKGAVRPKSSFLGQYDLFYTCELVYYARAKSELHAIREVSPLDLPRYKRTRKIIFAPVPRNPTGKIEKPKLRKMYGGEGLVDSQNKS